MQICPVEKVPSVMHEFSIQIRVYFVSFSPIFKTRHVLTVGHKVAVHARLAYKIVFRIFEFNNFAH